MAGLRCIRDTVRAEGQEARWAETAARREERGFLAGDSGDGTENI